MASDGSSAGREMLTPAVRKRLQQSFVHAGKQAAQDNFDYATELFTQCVLGDINNVVYWQSFFGNLRKKYNNNKKGAKLASIRTKRDWASVKKAQMSKDHKGVIKHGVEVLKLNPWDTGVLLTMATHAEALDLDEIPLIFLRLALDAAPGDPDVNRIAAKALRARKQFDQSIACWQRVLQAVPDDSEAASEIANLSVEKTISHGGYEGAETSQTVAVSGQGVPTRQELSREAMLRRLINQEPSNGENYVKLAEFYFSEEDYDKAEEILGEGFEATGNDPKMEERLLDAQLRRMRLDIRKKEQLYIDSQSDEAKLAWKKARKKYDLKFLESAQYRAKHFPKNMVYRYQLGQAYYVAGKFNEAIKELQIAKHDSTHQGECLLVLGKCFQNIKQYQLAASHYSQAIQKIPERDEDNLKTALYSAGRLSLGLKDYGSAEKYLTTLAGIDFGYKDVSALLDKIAKGRKNG